MSFLICLLYVLLGTVIGCLLSLIPSLHIYNVAGFALLIWQTSEHLIPYEFMPAFFMSMIVAFAFINTIPMTFMGAPDESATVTILPGTKYLTTSRGFEAAVLTGVGSLAGIALLIPLTGFFFLILPYVHVILSPHMHWVIGLVMVYMLMSEWPKGIGLGDNFWQRFKDAWGNLFAGIITFFFAGLLGLIVTSKSIVSHEMGFQNIMPVFVGLFAVPSIIQNLLSREHIPAQHIPEDVELDWKTVGQSTFQGGLGGLLAAYLPAVTAGIGGIIAGHATALRGDKIFIVSGGVSKVIYYVGAFMLLFSITPLTPAGIGRGGLAVILRPVFSARPGDYWLMLAVVIFVGCLSMLLMMRFAKWTLALLAKIDYRNLYIGAAVLVFAIIIGLTGLPGLFVATVATLIGSIPVFYHCRRSNCMAVLLVPIALNMAGYGSDILDLLGLV
ncbi:tripartite tricarboxylate transporter permease [bacterium]|nr:tripartite tricarboxylate transporter permease [candidate division CSSED10-310 bacterium]